jgi:death on curing protein
VKYLTEHQILVLHHRIIEKTGGGHGVRDAGLLQSAAGRPQSTFGGGDLYPTLFTKAAALLDSLARNHPFVDGNKRTAVAAVGLMLRINDWRLTAGYKELEDYVVDLVVNHPSIDVIAEWIEERCRPY